MLPYANSCNSWQFTFPGCEKRLGSHVAHTKRCLPTAELQDCAPGRLVSDEYPSSPYFRSAVCRLRSAIIYISTSCALSIPTFHSRSLVWFKLPSASPLTLQHILFSAYCSYAAFVEMRPNTGREGGTASVCSSPPHSAAWSNSSRHWPLAANPSGPTSILPQRRQGQRRLCSGGAGGRGKSKQKAFLCE